MSKKMLFHVSAAAASLALLAATTSCMTEREYMLRRQDMEIKANHPATYTPIVIKGPVTLDKDAELQVQVPTEPYRHTPIPDGQALQAQVVKDVVSTAALAGVAAYGIHEASGDTVVKQAPAESAATQQ